MNPLKSKHSEEARAAMINNVISLQSLPENFSLSFHDGDKIVGIFDLSTTPPTFIGDVDASAKTFVDTVLRICPTLHTGEEGDAQLSKIAQLTKERDEARTELARDDREIERLIKDMKLLNETQRTLQKERDTALDHLDNINVIFCKHYGDNNPTSPCPAGYGAFVDLLIKDVKALSETKRTLQKELRDAQIYGREKDKTATGFMNQVKRLQEDNERLREAGSKVLTGADAASNGGLAYKGVHRVLIENLRTALEPKP